jgi:hypothetical protein
MRTDAGVGGRRAPRGGTIARLALAAALALIALAFSSGVAGAKVVYGIVPQDGALPDAQDLDLMPQAGITSVRVIVHWGDVERTQGVYDWSSIDAVVREATKHGIEPFPFLYGMPDWAARADGYTCRDLCPPYAPKSPETRAAFARFAAAAVRRYGPNGDFWKAPTQLASGDGAAPAAEYSVCIPVPPIITCEPPPPPPEPPPPPPSEVPPPGQAPCGCTEPHPIRTWQIWNEQNSSKYFAPKVNVRRYASLLFAAGTAVKAEDPGADVVLGGMWGPESAKKVVTPVREYLTKLYAIRGIQKSFDSIAMHPYSSGAGASLAQLRSARNVVKKAHDRRAGMWVTEIGWAAGGPKKHPYVKGRKGQGRILARALGSYERSRRSLRLRGVFWYSWRDKPGGGAICEWCGHAGLRAKDGSAKPAWRAFARLAGS